MTLRTDKTTVDLLAKRKVMSAATKNKRKSAPAAKKQKTEPASRTKTIAFDDNQLWAIKQAMCCTKVAIPFLDGKEILYSGLGSCEMPYWSFPLVLEEPKAKGVLPQKYICGVPEPRNAFYAIKKAFKLLLEKGFFVGKEASNAKDWAVFKWNKQYYGGGHKMDEQTDKALRTMKLSTKAWGGPRYPIIQNPSRTLEQAKQKLLVPNTDSIGETAVPVSYLQGLIADSDARAAQPEFIEELKKKDAQAQKLGSDEEQDDDADESEESGSDDE